MWKIEDEEYWWLVTRTNCPLTKLRISGCSISLCLCNLRSGWWGWWLMVVEIMVVDSVVADKEKSALMSATQYAREGMVQLRVGWQTTSAGGSPHQSGDPNIDLRQGHTLWLRDQCLVIFEVFWSLLSCKYWYLVKCDVLQRWKLVKKRSLPAPKSEFAGLVCRWDPCVSVSPEPPAIEEKGSWRISLIRALWCWRHVCFS